VALPDFLIKQVPKQKNIRQIRALLEDSKLHTVCESASCPNIGECFSKQTLTFMILGNVCTRNCVFCGVPKGQPMPLDPLEPERIATAVKKLGLNYAVITSVTRDDLPDGGASQFAATIFECRISNIECRFEILIPDFQGNLDALKTVLAAKPYVLNHNIETVPSLYSKIRPQANYQQSLQLLKNSKKINKNIYTKSGFMVGLGEDKGEILAVLEDLRDVQCEIVTIGQYLAPSKAHLKPVRYVTPQEFAELQQFGESLGFKKVFSGPFVRSSYHAGEIVKCTNQKD